MPKFSASPSKRALEVFLLVTAIALVALSCCCLRGGDGTASDQGKTHDEAVHVPIASPDQSAGTVAGDMKGNETQIPVASPSAGRDVGGDAAVAKVTVPVLSPDTAAANQTTQTGLINLSLSNASAARSGFEMILFVATALSIWKWKYWKGAAADLIQGVETAEGSRETGGFDLKGLLARKHAATTAVGRLVEKTTRRKQR